MSFRWSVERSQRRVAGNAIPPSRLRDGGYGFGGSHYAIVQSSRSAAVDMTSDEGKQ